MNHHPYEDWLFADLDPHEKALDSEERAALQAHLRTCESCRQLAGAWQEVEAQFKTVSPEEPAPGFSARWQARLEADRLRLQRRQSLAMLGFSLGGAALLLASLVVLTWPLFQSPSLLVWTSFLRLLHLLSVAETLREFLTGMAVNFAGSIPLLGWVLMAGLLSQLAVLWFISIRWLTSPRRVTK